MVFETIRPSTPQRSKILCHGGIRGFTAHLKWLAKASDAIVHYWQEKNARKNSELALAE